MPCLCFWRTWATKASTLEPFQIEALQLNAFIWSVLSADLTCQLKKPRWCWGICLTFSAPGAGVTASCAPGAFLTASANTTPVSATSPGQNRISQCSISRDDSHVFQKPSLSCPNSFLSVSDDLWTLPFSQITGCSRNEMRKLGCLRWGHQVH